MKRVAATALIAIGLLHGPGAGSQATSDGGQDSSAAAQAAADQAKAEAARQLRAQTSDFTVVTIEPTQWSDSSLGCSKPGLMYTQVVSDGYTVVLEREGRRYQVNVSGSRAVMCEPATRITGTVRQPMSAHGLDKMAMLARQDLANRLRLDVQHIRVANIEPRRWTDDDMNCSTGSGSPATDAPSGVGYRLALAASGRTYFYHTDLRSVRACPPIENQ
jgi:hypothetical protein